MAGGAPTDRQRLDDPERLAALALARHELMDSGPEQVFDRLTRIATRLLGTPFTFLTPPEDRRDDRESRFSLPLTDSEGNMLGTLCAIDEAPKRWTDEDVELLSGLAAGAIAQVELRRLRPQVERLAAIVQRSSDELQRLADHDPLTGLFNRRRFEQELARTISFVDRYATPSALFLIDLDGFRAVVDTLGPASGDELLTRVAAALKSTMRETDVVGRLGGDEFAVIAISVGLAEAQVVAEKMLAAVREHGVVVSDGRRTAVSASIGVTVLDHETRLDGEALLARADEAMYAAKQAGRDRIAFGDPVGDDSIVSPPRASDARP
jgi:diguanylate cyclase (GGDEF)-like protein